MDLLDSKIYRPGHCSDNAFCYTIKDNKGKSFGNYSNHCKKLVDLQKSN